MSHMVETMAYAGEVPWHGLGRKVPNNLTPEQMMEVAGVNWTVYERLSYVFFEGNELATGQKALIRSDTMAVLSHVSKDWKTVQNIDAFRFFNEYIHAGDMEMHTAGSLKGGRIVWALAKVKESFEIFGGDRVDSYLLFSNPHEYGKAIDVRFTPIRVVCNNTLTFAIGSRSKNAVRIQHSTEFDAEKVKRTLGIFHGQFGKYRKQVEYLGSRLFKRDKVEEYFREVFPIKTSRNGIEDFSAVANDNREPVLESMELSRSAKRCLELVDNQPGAKYAEGSWWQAYNAVCYFTDHEFGKTAENRLHSQWFGDNRNVKRKASNLAMKYARAA